MPPTVTANVPLGPRTTLAAGGVAQYFAEASSLEALREVVQWARRENHAVHVLGGGSNVLVPDTGVRGLVVHPLFSDVTYEEVGASVHVTAGAGVVLDGLIEELVSRELWGMENLSGIPGTVGGVPIQNVGAYGVEGKDVIVSVAGYVPTNDTVVTLSNEACMFAYRDSYFKHEGRHLIITSVTFVLSRVATPKLSYKKTLFSVLERRHRQRCLTYGTQSSLSVAQSFLIGVLRALQDLFSRIRLSVKLITIRCAQ